MQMRFKMRKVRVESLLYFISSSKSVRGKEKEKEKEKKGRKEGGKKDGVEEG